MTNPEEGSFLVNNPTGSGSSQIVWTNAPCVLVPSLTISVGDRFANVLAALGDLGCFRRLIPDDAEDGFLQSDGGEWVLGPLPEANIPDPLTVGQIIVTDAATVVNLTVTGNMCSPAMPAGEIVSVVGLNEDGCLVKQASGGGGTSPLGVSMALYYENENDTSSATAEPNVSISNGAYAIIGNEIYNADGITSIVSNDTIKILTAGTYEIQWAGVFKKYTEMQKSVNLGLEINGGTVILGEGDGVINSTQAALVVGFTIRTFAVNDTVKIKFTSNPTSLTAPLIKAKLRFIRFGS